MIHISRSGATLGTFSEEDVREGLRTGRFIGTDLAWREGMPTWQPLSQFAEFAAEPTPAIAPPPVGGPTPPPSQPPTALSTVPPTSTEVLEPRSGLPWEHRTERGFVGAFFETLVMVLTKPAVAFTVMRREGGLLDPLFYALIGGSIGVLISLLFTLIMPSFGSFGDQQSSLFAAAGVGIGMIMILIFVPICIILGVFIIAALIHVCLIIVGGAKQSFETTFRVVCFATGSTQPLVIVPFCGGFIAFVWGLVAESIGVARAHETDIGRAVLAVLLPVILCCGAIGLLMTFGVFGALTALGQHSGQ